MNRPPTAAEPPTDTAPGGLLNGLIRAFLHSQLSLILVVLAAGLGVAALLVTPREEDPQIVVPLADVLVDFPGHSAAEVEQLVTTPLEKILYQIDGVEYVYSQSRHGAALITVRFFVGEDRERSLVKLFKRMDESRDLVPPGVAGWIMKPVEIDDVPILTLTLTSTQADSFTLRRVADEVAERLAAVPDVSRASVVGGEAREIQVRLDPERMAARSVDPRSVVRALQAGNIRREVGDWSARDQMVTVHAGDSFRSVSELRELVVGVSDDRPVFLGEVATLEDGPAEILDRVHHGYGPAASTATRHGFPGTRVGGAAPAASLEPGDSAPAVTLALAKKKGTNAVTVAERVLAAAEELRREVIPEDMDLVVTRNYGLTADDKVDELVEALAVAVFMVIALLTLSLGWREALVVAVAVPVVFGLTLTLNWMFGYTINRVTLFALILSIGLLVDDPIVDVENITRHFALRKRATRAIVLDAVSEIRPPLITATLAVIVSFLPMFFITGMMGPYMQPMALNVPVAMLMSMVVAFTITPWLAFHMLKGRYQQGGEAIAGHAELDRDALRASLLYRLFRPLMAPLLKERWRTWTFLGVMGGLTLLATGLAATRHVPMKMLPFDNKNELQLLLDFDEGTTMERADVAVREMERALAQVPEVTCFTSYVGLASPMDFNGMVRHYYLRQGGHVAELRVNLAEKKQRAMQSHAIGLRLRDSLTELAARHGARLKIVETPPGPPVISTLVAEVRGRSDDSYAALVDAASAVRSRLEVEPGVREVDDSVEAATRRLTFVTDKEKAALHGITTEDVVHTLGIALGGENAGLLHDPDERHPLRIQVRLPRAQRARPDALTALHVRGAGGDLVPLAELGSFEEDNVETTIHHKNLERVVYVFAECVGRPPADVVVDVQADRRDLLFFKDNPAPAEPKSRPLAARTHLSPGGDLPWAVFPDINVDFAGEGEWKITLDVFRDLGLAFVAALAGIYVLLVAQTGSFLIPVVVMLAIPLTMLGILPGFWLLNALVGGEVGGYLDPVFFTATGMIGMIALAGIVTRDSVILVDFIHLSQKRGRSLFDAVMESRVVRLRPILLTTGTAMLSAFPIVLDPIFSGLAWALIFGLFAATLFTLFVIPLAYWLVYAGPEDRREAGG